MNRVSRRSAAEAAEALLEVGRTEPVLDYDVELGLARHHDRLRSEPPMPEWASATAGSTSASFATIAIKTIVSAVLVGALATAAWQARDLLQPSAAEPQASQDDFMPSAPGLSATEEEAAQSPKPIPVPDHALHNEPPQRRASRANAPDKRAPRVQRAHKEPARVESMPAPLEAASPSPSPQPEPAAAVTATTPVTPPARKAVTAAQKARPEPGQQAQGPDDLAEMQQVAKAEQLLERSPARALALVREGDQRFARGYFQQERAYIAIMALIRLGRVEEARARATSFASQFPALPYGARIRAALDAAAAHDANP